MKSSVDIRHSCRDRSVCYEYRCDEILVNSEESIGRPRQHVPIPYFVFPSFSLASLKEGRYHAANFRLTYHKNIRHPAVWAPICVSRSCWITTHKTIFIFSRFWCCLEMHTSRTVVSVCHNKWLKRLEPIETQTAVVQEEAQVVCVAVDATIISCFSTLSSLFSLGRRVCEIRAYLCGFARVNYIPRRPRLKRTQLSPSLIFSFSIHIASCTFHKQRSRKHITTRTPLSWRSLGSITAFEYSLRRQPSMFAPPKFTTWFVTVSPQKWYREVDSVSPNKSIFVPISSR